MRKSKKLRKTINEISSGLQHIKGQAPALETLLQYGRVSALPEIIMTPKSQTTEHLKIYEMSNYFQKMILQSQSSDSILQKEPQHISFYKYKTQNNKAHYIKKPEQKFDKSKVTRNPPKLSELQRSRVLTMPSELNHLKQSLKGLPSVGLSPPKRANLRIATEGSIHRTPHRKLQMNRPNSFASNSLLKSLSINNDSQLLMFSKNRENASRIRYSKEKVSKKYLNSIQRRQTYLKNIRQIIDKSVSPEQKLKNRLTEEDKSKWENSLQKLKRFMSFHEPPSQTLMKLIEDVKQIQNQEQGIIQKQVLSEAKDPKGLKFKMALENEHQLYKRRLKKFIDTRKRQKMDMAKLEAVKVNDKRDTTGVDKIKDMEVLDKRKQQTKTGRTQETLQFCSRCGVQ